MDTGDLCSTCDRLDQQSRNERPREYIRGKLNTGDLLAGTRQRALVDRRHDIVACLCPIRGEKRTSLGDTERCTRKDAVSAISVAEHRIVLEDVKRGDAVLLPKISARRVRANGDVASCESTDDGRRAVAAERGGGRSRD